MRLLLGSIFCLTLAAVVGLGSTWLALSRGIAVSTLKLGAWSAHPKAGTADIDPYARAAIERSGELPIGVGDGISFTARTDDNARTLDGRCDVVVSGTTPQARFFTLTLYGRDGRLVANALNRHGFTSQELIRKADGRFDIVLGPRARTGNWLPTGGVERYVIVLRLYDTPVGIATRSGREAPMPTITLGRCQ